MSERSLGDDKKIAETQLVCSLWPVVSSGPINTDQRYTRYCATCLDPRIKGLWKFGRFDGITDTEAYRRLDYVLNHNRFAFIVGDKKEVEKATKKPGESICEAQSHS